MRGKQSGLKIMILLLNLALIVIIFPITVGLVSNSMLPEVSNFMLGFDKKLLFFSNVRCLFFSLTVKAFMVI